MQNEQNRNKKGFPELVDRYKNIIFILLFIFFGLSIVDRLDDIAEKLKNVNYIDGTLTQILNGMPDK